MMLLIGLIVLVLSMLVRAFAYRESPGLIDPMWDAVDSVGALGSLLGVGLMLAALVTGALI